MTQRIHFTKMQGAGNDYIYVDASLYHIEDPASAAIAWSDRHNGIGADGLVLIGRADTNDADFSMRIFNADGSEARMCGNASRCIGKYVFEKGLTTKTKIRLQTLSGVKTLMLKPSSSLEPTESGGIESVTVDMGKPVLADEMQFRPMESLMKGTFVSMGNPHYVIFTEDVDQVEELGPKLEFHEAFPQRCNIEFAHVEADGQIRMRVWERGEGLGTRQWCDNGMWYGCLCYRCGSRIDRQRWASVEYRDGWRDFEHRMERAGRTHLYDRTCGICV